MGTWVLHLIGVERWPRNQTPKSKSSEIAGSDTPEVTLLAREGGRENEEHRYEGGRQKFFSVNGGKVRTLRGSGS